ncbi:MAG TPA: hypothetical protein VD932_03925 [Aquabacterium sp.]|nr:hypothetical protein [Aquabacterium sp.]
MTVRIYLLTIAYSWVLGMSFEFARLNLVGMFFWVAGLSVYLVCVLHWLVLLDRLDHSLLPRSFDEVRFPSVPPREGEQP